MYAVTEGEIDVPLVELIGRAEAGDPGSLRDLATTREPDALPQLLAALPDASGHVAEAIILALGRFKADASAIALAQFLDPYFETPGRYDPDPGLPGDEYWMAADHMNDCRRRHWFAAQSLRKIRTPLALDMLAANNCISWLAGACVLAKSPDPAYLPMLRKAQPRTGNPAVGFTFVVARLRCGDATAIADLRTIAADPEHPCQEKAQRRLDRDPYVRKLLADPQDR
jgi:hypothetical protein